MEMIQVHRLGLTEFWHALNGAITSSDTTDWDAFRSLAAELTKQLAVRIDQKMAAGTPALIECTVRTIISRQRFMKCHAHELRTLRAKLRDVLVKSAA